MTSVSIPREKFDKVLTDIEILIKDVGSLLNLDNIAKRRLAEVKKNPSILKSEKELNQYLKKRGIKVD